MQRPKLSYFLSRYLNNIQGWKTTRKIIVIESDDWGSIRMPSRQVYQKCLKAGYRVDLNPYERYDSLASKEDLELLFDLLLNFKDKNGQPPVITANCVVANPDFKKIKDSGFSKYYFESITQTFSKYPNHSTNFNLWLKGLQQNLFFPQFHAREHLNFNLFLSELKKKNQDVLFAFENKMPGIIKKTNQKTGNSFVNATMFDSLEDKNDKLKAYLNGLEIFEKLFGFKSESIIPPNYTWTDDFNVETAKKGVRYIQGIRKFREPIPEKKPNFYSRILGGINSNKQISLVRNCFFEPTLRPNINSVDYCLREIQAAFLMKKPAIISSHRINFVGFIDPKNRDKNLVQFSTLLSTIKKKWPNVEFMNSTQLGFLIQSEKFKNRNTT